MANWDQAQLTEVIERRHGEDNQKKSTTTQIVSDMKAIQIHRKQPFLSEER